ncbi:MAG TPA: hypothetical protein PKI36_11005, partial [Turneriella sp.]|nr:hypothetical protein [Turneriella sp.]
MKTGHLWRFCERFRQEIALADSRLSERFHAKGGFFRVFLALNRPELPAVPVSMFDVPRPDREHHLA